MAKGSSAIVAGLTAAAVAAVGFLAYQASANAPDSVTAPSAGASAGVSPGASPKPGPPRSPMAVPDDSGTGARVVYALAERRVWLVDAREKSLRTFPVMPSAVSPLPGEYQVSSRSGSIKGSDGVPIEHVVRFADVGDVSVGFSAAQDGSMKAPDPSMKTGGVRMKRTDGNALWTFATVGATVVVVP
ncbi:MAG TPA: hypothetical protein DD420_05210 [Streptomyces sp.]|uniref:L,D-transpeptidase n=1 Tax=Streptomyces salyersiae TaxID=3075530 RepID=A0ABU2RH17_9ACTN|nr:hypothetical protein [Streptomyces sp. DSM 41770]MDT0428157.1 hypothetical protein [Streptomyces sp. DSM 41770]HBF79340.1 hypothetical protein [Streptomyces sp.]